MRWSDHQTGRQARTPQALVIERPERVFEQRPIQRFGQLHQLVMTIDHRQETRAKQALTAVAISLDQITNKESDRARVELRR